MKPKRAKIIAEWTNDEGERVTFQKTRKWGVGEVYVLVLHDDPPSTAKAPICLDPPLVDFLITTLKRLNVEIKDGH